MATTKHDGVVVYPAQRQQVTRTYCLQSATRLRGAFKETSEVTSTQRTSGLNAPLSDCSALRTSKNTYSYLLYLIFIPRTLLYRYLLYLVHLLLCSLLCSALSSHVLLFALICCPLLDPRRATGQAVCTSFAVELSAALLQQ